MMTMTMITRMKTTTTTTMTTGTPLADVRAGPKSHRTAVYAAGTGSRSTVPAPKPVAPSPAPGHSARPAGPDPHSAFGSPTWPRVRMRVARR